MKLVYSFSAEEKVELSQVGGKGLSLIFMTRHGLPVPPGFVLTVAFFQPWLDAIQQTPEWTAVLSGIPEFRKQQCDALKAAAMAFELDEHQRTTLAQAVSSLKTAGKMPLLAVRSSSPEEDLAGASFAGGYETSLGVTETGLETAVRHSFASCLDERVFVYKQEHGFAVDRPRIAVIVQQQIAADVSGVAFSLNPRSNCYDEAVINANFGLGESVVSGAVTPDAFTVDKVSRAILARKTGQKEKVIRLAADGGTVEETSGGQERPSLTDAQVLQLTDMLSQVEDYYQHPIDIEWAFAADKLFLLQARPITAYIPLPPALQTPPGAPKRLYLDMTLVKQGIHEPMSVLGIDYMKAIQEAMFRDLMGKDDLVKIDGLACSLEGRSYVNISNSLLLQGKKRVINTWRTQDRLVADILEHLDEAEYKPEKTPPNMKGVILGTLRNSFKTGWQTLKAYRNPIAYKQMYRQKAEAFQAYVQAGNERSGRSQRGNSSSLRQTAQHMIGEYVPFTNDVTLPMTFAAEIARGRLKRIFKDDPPEIQAKIVYLERALPENVTLEMGLAMYHLARFPEIGACASDAEFSARLARRDFSSEFLEAWDIFMAQYGFRCARELDLATPRNYERPSSFWRQLHTIAQNRDPEHNPQAIFARSQAEREEAYQELWHIARQKGQRKARQLEKNYQILVAFGGYREVHKYYFIMIVDAFRRQVLNVAETLVGNGRLDSVAQIFDLTINDLDQAMTNPSLDLRAAAEKNSRFLRKIRHIREFPRLIDSRGKILHPPRRAAREGELVGEPISPGVVRGPVKVLHAPDEKPVLPGDILVARATDPGWTPLFLNAGGVILEVGGLLQHGALVAREYGKPCVAGIVNATEILKDDQIIEFDGTSGIVRLMESTPAAGL